ncbi:unnamed protein product [Bursaphelenchus okinawaensis]|uniref:Protein kinase domain-containing protein n=1 Tax=Bursaphelenchus okinawaensis TaxID=465554 RepID=A0A811KHV8_9BILA|nr:unnamed protein product [Bursaphelenchus okinawaensis]CAG9103544.1 unnamed protein product [Bursaphelenchus okinawaensis]
MSVFGNDQVSQAPSGSRLAQYLNGRNQQQQPQQQFMDQQQRFNNNGMNGFNTTEFDPNRGYSNNFIPSISNEEGINKSDLAMLTTNIPLVGLQVSNEDTLKQRWANAGHGSFFSEPDIRNELMQRQIAMQCHQSSSASEPVVVEHLRNLRQIGRTPVMRYGPTCMEYTYKGMNVNDGLTYSIHRISGVRQLSPYVMSQLDNWRRISNSNIVRFHEVVQTCAWSDNSVLFIYEFQPLAETILKHFFHSNGTLKSKYSGQGVTGLSEQLAWSFIIQISSAIRTIHSSQMASRCIDVNRIMVNASGRFVITGSGIPDALSEPNKNLISLQIEDLRMFGAVLCALLNGSINGHSNVNIDMHYSSDLRNVIKVLCSAHANPNRVTSINEIMPMVGARFYAQVEALQIRIDLLENDLVKELQNGRLFRLLCMLCTVTDRNLPKEPFWSEQSERYMLKLFRDFVFHQVDPYGRPVMDLEHVVLSLNKLDSGVDEMVQLASSDNENILLNSYKQLRQYLEGSFDYLKCEMETPITPDLSKPGPSMLGPNGQPMAPDSAMGMPPESFNDVPGYNVLPFAPNVPPPGPSRRQ